MKNVIDKSLAVMMIVLMSLASFVVYSNPAEAAPTDIPSFISIITNPSPGGQFNAPGDIALDGQRNIYVADTNNHRIQKFDSSGNYLAQWGGSGAGNGQFQYPFGIAIDSDSNIYVSDIFNNRIQKFDSSGNYLAQWGSNGAGNGQFYYPYGIAIDGAGDIYIADTHNHRIQKFDSSGNYLAQWGSNGVSDGQFLTPQSIAVDNIGNIYVADKGNNRVQKFDASGNFLAKWGSSGIGDGQFTSPTGIVVDSSGNIYVNDTNNNRIQKFNSSGDLLVKWGSSGIGDGQFGIPRGITVDDIGGIYVVEANNNRIQKFGYPAESSLSGAGGDIFLQGPIGTAFTCSSVVTASSLTPTDPDFTYPLDLASFCLNVAVSGATANMTATFQTTLLADQVVPRKYNPNTQSYSNVAGAVVTATTFNGQPALQIAYTATDGGPLDTDNVANGIILDPIGLGVRRSSPGSNSSNPDTPYGFNSPGMNERIGGTLAPTGDNTNILIILALVMVVMGAGYGIVATRNRIWT